MGLCQSNQPDDKQATQAENAKNRSIDDKMIKEHGVDSKILKLLFLGAGESGKSTLFKALRTIYGEGYPTEERQQFVEIVWTNTISAMKELVTNLDTYGTLTTPEAKVSKTFMEKLQKDGDMSDEVAKHIKTLWKDEGIQKTYEKRSNFQLFDSAGYFFNRIDEIASPEYLPTEEDVLRSRVRTTGIVESSFQIDGNHFKMFDVGGQRNERKKWIHCFENVTAVIFVVGISAYDQVLFEDEQTNRMIEALTLFDEICNSKWFQNTSMILFLNKMDLFQEKIQRVPLTTCFQNYQGKPGDEKTASEFIRDQFVEKNTQPKKKIYAHFTTATNTKNISHVFVAVKDIIISRSLIDAGLY